MKGKINIGINDDYAIIYSEGKNSWDEDESKVSFYYGYEYTENNDEDGEWLFVAKKDGDIVKQYTTSKLEEISSDNLGDPVEYLLTGIYAYINNL